MSGFWNGKATTETATNTVSSHLIQLRPTYRDLATNVMQAIAAHQIKMPVVDDGKPLPKSQILMRDSRP